MHLVGLSHLYEVVPVHAMKEQGRRGCSGIDLLILKVGAGRKWLISRPARFAPRERTLVPIEQEPG